MNLSINTSTEFYCMYLNPIGLLALPPLGLVRPRGLRGVNPINDVPRPVGDIDGEGIPGLAPAKVASVGGGGMVVVVAEGVGAEVLGGAGGDGCTLATSVEVGTSSLSRFSFKNVEP